MGFGVLSWGGEKFQNHRQVLAVERCKHANYQ